MYNGHFSVPWFTSRLSIVYKKVQPSKIEFNFFIWLLICLFSSIILFICMKIICTSYLYLRRLQLFHDNSYSSKQKSPIHFPEHTIYERNFSRSVSFRYIFLLQSALFVLYNGRTGSNCNRKRCAIICKL